MVALVGPLDAQVIWATKSLAGVPPDLSQAPTFLFRYEYSANALAFVDTVRIGGLDIDMDGLACTPNIGLIGYQHTGSGSQMVMLDTVTAVAVPFGPFLAGMEISAACWDGANDIMAIDRNNEDLLRIRSSDGTIISSVPITLSGTTFNVVGGDIDFIAGSCYLHQRYELFALDTLSGELTLIFEDIAVDTDDVLGSCMANSYAPNIGGLARIPLSNPPGYLSMDGNCEDDLYQYNILAPTPRTQWINDMSPGFNSGNMDLATDVNAISTSVVAGRQDLPALVAVHLPGIGIQVTGVAARPDADVLLLDGMGRLMATRAVTTGSSIVFAQPMASGVYTVHGPRTGQHNILKGPCGSPGHARRWGIYTPITTGIARQTISWMLADPRMPGHRRLARFFDFEGPNPEHMLRWAAIFLVIAIVAAVFGFGGLAEASAGIAKILFFLFLVLFLGALILGATVFKKK